MDSASHLQLVREHLREDALSTQAYLSHSTAAAYLPFLSFLSIECKLLPSGETDLAWCGISESDKSALADSGWIERHEIVQATGKPSRDWRTSLKEFARSWKNPESNAGKFVSHIWINQDLSLVTKINRYPFQAPWYYVMFHKPIFNTMILIPMIHKFSGMLGIDCGEPALESAERLFDELPLPGAFVSGFGISPHGNETAIRLLLLGGDLRFTTEFMEKIAGSCPSSWKEILFNIIAESASHTGILVDCRANASWKFAGLECYLPGNENYQKYIQWCGMLKGRNLNFPDLAKWVGESDSDAGTHQRWINHFKFQYNEQEAVRIKLYLGSRIMDVP